MRAGRGRPGKGSDATIIGRGKEYLAARLARDHRDLAAEVEAGRKSLRAAAREAGIVKPRDPYRELRRWWDVTAVSRPPSSAGRGV
jgi:hypothetical protein